MCWFDGQERPRYCVGCCSRPFDDKGQLPRGVTAALRWTRGARSRELAPLARTLRTDILGRLAEGRPQDGRRERQAMTARRHEGNAGRISRGSHFGRARRRGGIRPHSGDRFATGRRSCAAVRTSDEHALRPLSEAAPSSKRSSPPTRDAMRRPDRGSIRANEDRTPDMRAPVAENRRGEDHAGSYGIYEVAIREYQEQSRPDRPRGAQHIGGIAKRRLLAAGVQPARGAQGMSDASRRASSERRESHAARFGRRKVGRSRYQWRPCLAADSGAGSCSRPERSDRCGLFTVKPAPISGRRVDLGDRTYFA